jgi:hypothetical protein
MGGRGPYCHNHTGNPITKYFAKTIHHTYLINKILQKLYEMAEQQKISTKIKIDAL